LNPSVKTHPVVRLTEHGIDYGTEPQPGDEVGYAMDPYRTDDCFQAAIASATQVPIEQVPDLALDQRLWRGDDPEQVSDTSWERIQRWASKCGLALTFHSEVPVERSRWLGVCVAGHSDRAAFEIRPDGTWAERKDEVPPAFNDHCLVMSHARLIFDPSCSVRLPPGMQLMKYTPNHITYGISFDKEE